MGCHTSSWPDIIFANAALAPGSRVKTSLSCVEPGRCPFEHRPQGTDALKGSVRSVRPPFILYIVMYDLFLDAIILECTNLNGNGPSPRRGSVVSSQCRCIISTHEEGVIMV
jgi:hypothetical protein